MIKHLNFILIMIAIVCVSNMISIFLIQYYTTRLFGLQIEINQNQGRLNNAIVEYIMKDSKK